MKRTILLLMMGFLVTSVGFSQSRTRKKADHYYERLAYSKAIPYYRRVFEKEKDKDAVLRLAECYRLTHQFDSAAVWYDKAVEMGHNDEDVHFHHAHSKIHSGDYDAAKSSFMKHSHLDPDDPLGKTFAEALEKYHVMLQDSVNYSIELMPFNSDQSDFSAYPYLDGLVYASSREAGGATNRKFHWLDENFLRFFYTEPVEGKEGEWSKQPN